jgi:hypothetical protein
VPCCLPVAEEAALEKDPQIVELNKQAAVTVDSTERDQDI